MKARLVFLLVIAGVVGLSGCDFFMRTGDEGDVYISLTKDATAYVYSQYYGYSTYMPVYCNYLSFAELPSSVSFGTYYLIPGTGTYYGSYTMYAYEYGYVYFYDYSSQTSETYGEELVGYWGSVPDSGELDGYSYDFSYSVIANPGTTGFLSGDDGADKYYDLYLAYDPFNYAVSAASARGAARTALPCTTTMDDSGTITKTFVDDRYTITLTATPKAGPMPTLDLKPNTK